MIKAIIGHIVIIIKVVVLSLAKTQQVINIACTGSHNFLELSSSSVTLFFHWSKAKGNGNGGRLSSCLMVWEAASDWSKPYFSSTTHGGKRKLPEVAWSCTRLEEKLLITCCVFVLMISVLCLWMVNQWLDYLRQHPMPILASQAREGKNALKLVTLAKL